MIHVHSMGFLASTWLACGSFSRWRGNQPGTDPMHLQLETESEEEAGRSKAKRLEMQQELEKLKTLNSSSHSEKTALSAQVASLEE